MISCLAASVITLPHLAEDALVVLRADDDVSMRSGLLSGPYSTVTWLLASGRSHLISPDWRSWASFSTMRCDRWIGSGISTSVSLQA